MSEREFEREIEKLKDFQKAKERTVEGLKAEIRELEEKIERLETGTIDLDSDELREALADLCHEQWSGWMECLFSKCFVSGAGVTFREEYRMRWRRQADTDYDDLSEEEKESDRKEADRFLQLLRDFR